MGNYLNGIDISAWQTGINLAAVPADFVIIKVTEGTGYENPDWRRQYQQAKSSGKRLGLYHYANGRDVVGEANYFLGKIQDCIGTAMLFLDWEKENNPTFGVNDYNWCNHWLSYVKQKTGVTPVIYISQSVMPVLQNLKFEFWIAQYANMNATGYQSNPWNEGAYGCLIRQYSSRGRLPGYGGDLDLNKFYGSGADWDKRAKTRSSPENGASSSKPGPTVVQAPTESTLQVAVDVMQRRYGDGEIRKKALGYRYNEVQNFINHISTAPKETLAAEVKQGKYGDGEMRRIVLGVRYNEVQDLIDRQENSGGTWYVILSGDTLSGIAARYGTTWQQLAQINGIRNPNYIMPGQRIRVR